MQKRMRSYSHSNQASSPSLKRRVGYEESEVTEIETRVVKSIRGINIDAVSGNSERVD